MTFCHQFWGVAISRPPLFNPLRFMDTLGALLSSKDRQIYLERSGMVTRCRLACEALDNGRSVVLVARSREEFNTARSLAVLFSPDLSLADPAVTRPVWQLPCLGLPALSQRQDRSSWAARLAALYALTLGRPRIVVASVESLLLRYMPVGFFASRTLELGKGSDYAPELLLDQAAEWGYERVPMRLFADARPWRPALRPAWRTASRLAVQVALLCCCLLLTACFEARLPDGVVATVNGEPITLRRLQALLDSRSPSLGTMRSNPSLEKMKHAYGEALGTLIIYALVRQDLHRLHMQSAESVDPGNLANRPPVTAPAASAPTAAPQAADQPGNAPGVQSAAKPGVAANAQPAQPSAAPSAQNGAPGLPPVRLPAQAAPAPAASAFPASSAPAASAAGEEQQSSPHKVIITATDECWVHSSADKTDTRQFSLHKGDTFALTFNKSLELKLGNAGGVRLRYNGQDLPPVGQNGQVRTLVFPPAERPWATKPAGSRPFAVGWPIAALPSWRTTPRGRGVFPRLTSSAASWANSTRCKASWAASMRTAKARARPWPMPWASSICPPGRNRPCPRVLPARCFPWPIRLTPWPVASAWA